MSKIKGESQHGYCINIEDLMLLQSKKEMPIIKWTKLCNISLVTFIIYLCMALFLLHWKSINTNRRNACTY